MLSLLFLFKQKTANELRIMDWSSDVCSSDLEATRLDPGYALAYANQTIAWINISSLRTGPARQQAIAQARAAANTALAVDPEIGASYSAIAMVQSYVDHDWAGAEASLRPALRLKPGSANIKMTLGSLTRKSVLEAQSGSESVGTRGRLSIN